MQNHEGQMTVKQFLSGHYNSKLEESKLLEGSKNVTDFFSILLDMAKNQNNNHVGYPQAIFLRCASYHTPATACGDA